MRILILALSSSIGFLFRRSSIWILFTALEIGFPSTQLDNCGVLYTLMLLLRHSSTILNRFSKLRPSSGKISALAPASLILEIKLSEYCTTGLFKILSLLVALLLDKNPMISKRLGCSASIPAVMEIEFSYTNKCNKYFLGEFTNDYDSSSGKFSNSWCYFLILKSHIYVDPKLIIPALSQF